MMRIFASTPFYAQGPGALADVGAIASRHGNRPVIVIDALVRERFETTLKQGFSTPVVVIPFTGELTDAAVSELAVEASDSDVVIAVGGGKALDAGKAAALRLAVPVVCVPTIASTDGPASRGIAMYDEAHRLVRVDQMPSNPAAVVVDSRVIAQAPVRYLRAGIGDAIAKTFEADACWANGGLTKHGTRPTHSARAIARAAHELLRRHAITAIADVERQQVTEALEATLEACVLLSALGFENGGLSIAHSVTRGLMTLRGARDRLHGEHVAYATLVQLAVELRDDAELDELAEFLTAVGLPCSLAQLGVDTPQETDFAGIAVATIASPHMKVLADIVSAGDVSEAIGRVERLAEARKAPMTHT
jgi:glycerol dehydrogenase